MYIHEMILHLTYECVCMCMYMCAFSEETEFEISFYKLEYVNMIKNMLLQMIHLMGLHALTHTHTYIQRFTQ